MKKLIYLLFLAPLGLSSQVTVFSTQQDLFNLSANHYQLSHPMKPIVTSDSTVNFMGFTGGELTLYSKDQAGVYNGAKIPVDEFEQAILAYEDFNGDGLIDILSNNSLLKNENGSYKKVFFSNVFLKPKGFGDFNGDGLLDIIAFESGVFNKDKLFFLKNKGDFKFDEILIESGETEYQTFASGDIDNDGDLDFVMTTFKNGYPVRIYFNDGNANFTSKEKSVFADDCWTMNVELFDFENDNDLDLLLIDQYSGVYIFENTDDFETFEYKNDFRLSNISSPLIVRPYDFNQDNLTDLVVFRQTQNDLYVDYYEANGHYLFKPKKQLMAFKGGIFIYILDGTVVTKNLNFVDLNKDGKMDITVTAGFDKKQIAVYNNTILSSSEDLLTETFSLTPNVVNDYLYLNFPENTRLQIFNTNGELIMNSHLTEQNLNISALNSGIYFLNAFTKDGKLSTSKFVKID